MPSLTLRRPMAALLALFAVVAPLAAQTGYQQPPAAVAQVLDAPATPTVLTSPDRSLLILLERPGLPSIAEISAPEYRLAGLRLNPRTNGPSRQFGARGLSVLPVSGGDVQRIAAALPDGAGITNANWSPNGRLMAFIVTTDDALTLWVADPCRAHGTAGERAASQRCAGRTLRLDD